MIGGMRRPILVLAAALMALPLPALAQFPPPGVYFCSTSQGAVFATLDLFAAGDYQLLRDNGATGTGQIASAGSSLRALSGPLAELRVKGVFSTDGEGQTRFLLDSAIGPIDCGPME